MGKRSKVLPVIKIKAVTDYKNGKGSLYDICAKYNISSHSILINWIKKYNSNKIVKTYRSKGAKIITNGRKTTYK